MSAPTLLVRPATPDDMAFVWTTWINSYSFTIRDRSRRCAAAAMRKSYVDPILRLSPRLMVLCSPDNPRALHGHAVATKEALAWVYVTKDLREQGYGRQLIEGVLGEYPACIQVHWKWPFESGRYTFLKFEPSKTGRQSAA